MMEDQDLDYDKPLVQTPSTYSPYEHYPGYFSPCLRGAELTEIDTLPGRDLSPIVHQYWDDYGLGPNKIGDMAARARASPVGNGGEAF